MLNVNYFLTIIMHIIIFAMNGDSSHTQLNSLGIAGVNFTAQSDLLEEKLYKNNRLPFVFCGSVFPLIRTRFCDGKKDCPDGSDETSNSCKDRRCSKEEFRCNYGACVSKKVICDGVFDCADGSDEDKLVCKASNCILPSSIDSTAYYVLGCSDCQASTEVEPGTVLEAQCLNNFVLPFSRAICKNSKWIPSVPICKNNKVKE